MAIGIAYRIIIKEISLEIAFNIIDLEDLKDIWTKLKNIYNKVGQGVVYLIFQEIFNYLRINKPKRYDKPIMQIFAEVYYFYKRFQIVMILNKDF